MDPSRLPSIPSAADVNSSVSLSDTINSFIDDHLGIACFHEKALESDKQFDLFVDRDDCMQELCESMEKQLGVMSSRAPLHAAAGAPGAGKTRFLLKLQDKEFVHESATRFMKPSNAALFHPDNVLVINITFNSIMPTQDIEFASTIDQMICARLLFQYFGPELLGLSAECRFSKFFVDLSHRFGPGYLKLDAEDCLQCIFRHFVSTIPASSPTDSSKRTICILGIDEIIKSRRFEPETKVADETFVTRGISRIGQWSDGLFPVTGTDRKFVLVPVITSLSQLIVGNSAKPSARIISWIPLSPLYSVADQVCEKLQLVQASDHQAIQILCTYLGNHGRLVEILVELLQSKRSYLLNLSGSMIQIFTSLKEDARAKDYQVLADEDYSLSIVAAAIRGDTLKSVDQPGSARTVDNLILSGVYIDSIIIRSIATADMKVIPRLSLFQMYTWAMDRVDNGDTESFAGALYDFLTPRAVFTSDSFERFHACFEYLCRATEAYSMYPQQLHTRLRLRSVYTAKDLRSLARLVPGVVELQELSSVVDLKQLSNYPTGIDAPRHQDTTHLIRHFQSFARNPDEVVVPTHDIAASLTIQAGGDLSALIALSAPKQPMFDAMSDSRYMLADSQERRVRDFYELKLKTNTEVEMREWLNDRVLPFMTGVPKCDRFQYRFWFISTGKISDLQRADAVTLCQQQHIQLFIFEEAQLEELYGPSLFCYPSFDSLDNLKDAIRQAKALKRSAKAAEMVPVESSSSHAKRAKTAGSAGTGPTALDVAEVAAHPEVDAPDHADL